jgi:hypothetical protein
MTRFGHMATEIHLFFSELAMAKWHNQISHRFHRLPQIE